MNIISKIRLKARFKKYGFYHSDDEHDYSSFVQLEIEDVLKFKSNLFNSKLNIKFKNKKRYLRCVKNDYKPALKPSFWERNSFSYFICKQ